MYSMEKKTPKSSEFSHWPSGSEMFDDFLKSSQGCLHHPSAQTSLHSRTLPQLNQKKLQRCGRQRLQHTFKQCGTWLM